MSESGKFENSDRGPQMNRREFLGALAGALVVQKAEASEYENMMQFEKNPNKFILESYLHVNEDKLQKAVIDLKNLLNDQLKLTHATPDEILHNHRAERRNAGYTKEAALREANEKLVPNILKLSIDAVRRKRDGKNKDSLIFIYRTTSGNILDAFEAFGGDVEEVVADPTALDNEKSQRAMKNLRGFLETAHGYTQMHIVFPPINKEP